MIQNAEFGNLYTSLPRPCFLDPWGVWHRLYCLKNSHGALLDSPVPLGDMVGFITGSPSTTAPPTGRVESATGSGEIEIATDAGTLQSLSAVHEIDLPLAGKPENVSFPFGLLAWTVTGLKPGTGVTVRITYPGPIPPGQEYWKVIGPNCVNVSSLLGDNDGDNVLTLTIADGGLGDADGEVNGAVSDPGGVALPIGVAPTITGAPPTPATTGTPYNFAFTTTGTPAPTVTVSTGGVPPGLELSSAGVLSGTPNLVGTYTFTLKAANGVTPDAVTGSLTIVVDPAPVAPTITGTPPTPATVGTPYNFAFIVTGTPAPTVTVASGGLLAGLTLSPVGVLSGTPTTAGTHNFTVKAANGANPDAVTGTLTIVVNPRPVPCSAGTYSATGNTPCTPAPAGSYVPTAGATSATPCPAGTFSSASGATECTPAPAGSYVGGAGSTAATPCAPGTFSSTAGATACTLAPVDTYVAAGGATTATPCPTGTSTGGLTSQTACTRTLQNSNQNHNLTGDWFVAGTVKGNIRITDGSLTVLGCVEGNIEQLGAGSVIVAAGACAKGDVQESGTGDVRVAGAVDGNVQESGVGDVVVAGSVKGNVTERDAGSLTVSGRVDGNVEESGVGNLTITATGVVRGNATEKDPGTGTNAGTVTGNFSQS